MLGQKLSPPPDIANNHVKNAHRTQARRHCQSFVQVLSCVTVFGICFEKPIRHHLDQLHEGDVPKNYLHYHASRTRCLCADDTSVHSLRSGLIFNTLRNKRTSVLKLLLQDAISVNMTKTNKPKVATLQIARRGQGPFLRYDLQLIVPHKTQQIRGTGLLCKRIRRSAPKKMISCSENSSPLY